MIQPGLTAFRLEYEAMKKLIGKVAIVTGASKGLGRRISEALVEQGARVALLARESAELDALAEKLGTAALRCPCDVRSPGSVREAVSAAVRHFGGLDIVINNAAACLLHRIEESTDEEILCEVETNLLGTMWCVREAVPHLQQRDGGDIVIVTSESVDMPYPFLTVYASTKGGLETFALGLRSELREFGTRVMVLRSGFMHGSSMGKAWNTDRAEIFSKTIQRSGHAAFSGAGIQPEIAAQAVVDVLCLPREATVDFIEVRSTR